jgi:hypothetical protein
LSLPRAFGLGYLVSFLKKEFLIPTLRWLTPWTQVYTTALAINPILPPFPRKPLLPQPAPLSGALGTEHVINHRDKEVAFFSTRNGQPSCDQLPGQLPPWVGVGQRMKITAHAHDHREGGVLLFQALDEVSCMLGQVLKGHCQQGNPS